MGMRIQNDDGQRCELRGDLLDVAHAHTSIEKQRALVADDEITDHFLKLVGLVDGKYRRRYFINFKPRIADVDTLEFLVLGARQRVAPIGNHALRQPSYSPDEQAEENSESR